ncbi:hypothetical protein [Mangrovimonas sp. YM274]|uniref:hypothetical protein n=1 Tax=Mangrovimonas sp. YM274 TaxID=3070660 RepID=UPI0027DC88D3|nr:hypothetical protein [Mangrovimonas sp. YM274]WMI67536.1 hypothetical protein RBH95_10300 [Mangrovimonas sp. YM274]
MKKLFALLMFASLLFTACEGDQGPPGPPGQPGSIFVASAFEIEVDFTSGNGYQILEPYGFQVYPSDVVLVYISWEFDGQDIWRPLPQTAEFVEGSLVYNFDFTQDDVRLFLDGTINPDILGPEWTQDQYFRVVVVPADNIDGVDLNNLDAVMEAGGISTFEQK